MCCSLQSASIVAIAQVLNLLRVNEDFAAREFRMRRKSVFIFDMDGVIYRGDRLIEGVPRLIEWLQANNKTIRFLTNNSNATPARLRAKLAGMGVAEHALSDDMFWTSALSTAAFLKSQKPHGCRAFVVGGEGIHQALEGIVREADEDVEYVVVGEATDYSTKDIRQAVTLVDRGAILIGTNEDVSSPTADGIEPSCGAWVKIIETVRVCACGRVCVCVCVCVGELTWKHGGARSCSPLPLPPPLRNGQNAQKVWTIFGPNLAPKLPQNFSACIGG